MHRANFFTTGARLAAAALLIALAGGCSASVAQDPAPADLILAVGKGLEAIPLIAAAEMGFFEAEGVTVELIFTDHWREVETALQAGAVDGGQGSLYSLIRLQERGFLVMAASTTGAGYILAVSASRGDSFAALLGAAVSLSDDPAEQYLLEALLAENNLKPADISLLVYESPAAALEGYRQGRGEALFLPWRLGVEALHDGAIRLDAAPGELFSGGVFMFGGEALQEKTAKITSFYRAYGAAVLALNEGRFDFRSSAFQQWGFPEKWLEEERPYFAKPRPLAKDEVNDFLFWLRRRNPEALLPDFEALVWREEHAGLLSD